MSSADEDRKNVEAKMKRAIEQKLIETGEKEKLKELLRTRLIECGWHDQLKIHCKDIIKKKGHDSLTVDTLVQEMTPYGRNCIPDSVKRELLQRIRAYLAQQQGI